MTSGKQASFGNPSRGLGPPAGDAGTTAGVRPRQAAGRHRAASMHLFCRPAFHVRSIPGAASGSPRDVTSATIFHAGGDTVSPSRAVFGHPLREGGRALLVGAARDRDGASWFANCMPRQLRPLTPRIATTSPGVDRLWRSGPVDREASRSKGGCGCCGVPTFAKSEPDPISGTDKLYDCAEITAAKRPSGSFHMRSYHLVGRCRSKSERDFRHSKCRKASK